MQAPVVMSSFLWLNVDLANAYRKKEYAKKHLRSGLGTTVSSSFSALVRAAPGFSVNR